MELYSVWNAYEELQFNGTKLAHSSTETPDSLRWIEIEIYKTERGRYVIHRVGVSLVYHKHNGSCTGKGVKTRMADVNSDAMPCKECNPPPLQYSEEGFVDAEQDRHTTDVCTASEVHDRLMVKPYRGEPFLSSPARKALDQAIAADSELNEKTNNVRFIE